MITESLPFNTQDAMEQELAYIMNQAQLPLWNMLLHSGATASGGGRRPAEVSKRQHRDGEQRLYELWRWMFQLPTPTTVPSFVLFGHPYQHLSPKGALYADTHIRNKEARTLTRRNLMFI
jgi:hypothetical protein